MKIGMRRPSLRKSISARTTGRAKRAIKRAIIPGYGKKGMGWLHPQKAIYNRVYRRTTFSIFDLAKASSKKSGASNSGCCVTLLFMVFIIGLCISLM
ncbi:gp2 [gut metagenome]|uniref:Gp2 n=1 Tax=gut metagenome TaxID=749906 RepID=J9H6N7_9ZZZZ